MGRGLTYHEKRRAGGNDGALVGNVFNVGAGEADGDDGPEAQRLFDERGDVWDFFLDEALFPGVAVGVGLLDGGEGLFLDGLAGGRRQVREAHNQCARNGIETSRDHGEADGLEFRCECISKVLV